MLCDKYIVDITWPRGDYKIRKRTCNVLFLNFNEIPSVALYSKCERYHKHIQTKHSMCLHGGIHGNMLFSLVKISLIT